MYPTQMTDELISAINDLDKVVKYIDIPLQHSNYRILKEMKRPVQDYRKLINKLRKRIPGVSIRTSIIVEDLYKFVKDVKFDRLGVFEYSREKNTYSYGLKPQISAKVKKQRLKKIMELQQKISKENNEKYINRELKCIVEGYTDSGTVILRSQHDAPEIDGLVYATTDSEVIPGDIETVRIEKSDEYDLYGKIIK